MANSLGPLVEVMSISYPSTPRCLVFETSTVLMASSDTAQNQESTTQDDKIRARTCRLMGLPRDIRICLLDQLHPASFLSMWNYMPLADDSFRELFQRHEASIFHGLRARYSAE